MKKLFISLFLACLAALATQAQTPTITLESDQLDVERTLEFKVKTDASTISIDWGDGNAVQTTEAMNLTDSWYTTAIKGTIKGTIKIYGDDITYFDCSSTVDGQKFTAIDVTNAGELLELYANTNSFSNIDLSQNASLLKFYCYANPITNLDLSTCAALTYLNCNNIQDSDIDFSACVALETLKCNENNISTLDLSHNTALKSLYAVGNLLTSIDLTNNVKLENLYVKDNLITAIDVTMCPNMRYLHCMNNKITSLQVDQIAKGIYCQNNRLTMATLPATNVSRYYYAPQSPIAITKVVKTGDAIDLSAQNNIQGVADAAKATTYVWQTEDGTSLVAGQDYTEADGIFTFSTTPAQPVRCLMTSDAFPKFSGVNALATTYVNNPTITLQSDQVDVERTLDFMVTSTNTKITIDWGDGNAVETEDAVIINNPWTTTKVTGTIKGEGVIKIYGPEISYFDCSSTVDGQKFSAINLTKAVELIKLYVNTNAFTAIDLSQNTKLAKLYCYSNPIADLDLTQNSALTYLNCNKIADSDIDLSGCTSLESLYCNENELATLDISHNTALKSLYATNNKLTSLDLTNNVNLENLYVKDNLLTSIDVSMCPKMRYLHCMNNKLTAMNVAQIAKGIYCQNNMLTMAALPAVNPSRYYYAPQAAMTIAESIKAGESIDLSAQTNLRGVTDTENATTFVWETEDGTALVAGEDYTVVDGVFTFTKAQATPVHCSMTSDAFPKFSGVNAFCTSNLTVAAATGINEATTGVTLTTANQSLQVTGVTAGSIIKVFSVNGEKVAAQIANESTTQFTLAKGFYVVVVDTKAYKVSIR
jgi:Leucine-rich repeat (LRR) protein